MIEREFYNRVTNSNIDIIHEFLQLLHKSKISYCVIGGVAVNAYCEPILTLDFDCAIILEQVERIRAELKRKGFQVKTPPHTFEVRHPASDVRIQIQRDKRYQEFIKNAKLHKVLGYTMRVDRKEDILMGKIWAYSDPDRDELKRDKDLFDIKRLVRTYSNLKALLNEELKKKLT